MSTLFGKRTERFLSVLLSVTVIVWSLGLFALTASVASAATLTEGDIIRGPDGIKVYIINDKGYKRHIFNPEVFNMYGHLKWENIKAVDQATLDSYTTSDLYRADGDQKVYQTADDGVKKWFDMTGDQFIASGYTFNQVFIVNPRERDFYSTGTSITYTEQQVISGQVTVALASDNPVAASVVAGQANADLAHITFANGTSSEVKVTDVKLQRMGVSADTTPSSVYLFDGATRLTDAATVFDGYVNFNNSAGIFALTAGASKTIKVLANIAAGTSGQTVGVKVTEVKTSPTSTVFGTPSGSLMTVATATVATVDFNSTTTPSSNTTTDPVNDYTVWQNVTTVGQRAVNFNRISLREIGSINYSDINNFRLYVDGVMVGSAVANLDSNGYVTFSNLAKRLDTGSRTIRVTADIIGGSNRNFSFSLRNAADASFTDTSYGVDVLSTVGGSTFSASTTGTITVNAGTLTVIKKTDSASGTVVDAGTDATFGTFEFKAAGEQIKVETLRVTIVSSDTDTGASKFRNGRLLIDGVQVGSTADIYEASNSTAAYTEYTVNFTVTPGTPRTLEVRADLVDNQGTDSVSNSDTLTARLVAGNLNNAQGLVSGTVIDAPHTSTNVDANTLTVGVGSLTLSKYSAYTNHTIVAPKTAYKIGHFILTGSTTEATTLTQFSIDFTGADSFSSTSDLSSVYVKYGSKTTDTKSTISSATSNTWAISSELAAGASMDIEVYASVASTATDGDGTADTNVVALTVTGTTVKSSTSVTGGATDGQTITAGASSISSATSGTTPLSQVVSGSQTINVAKFDWTAVSEAYAISEIRLELNPTVATADTAASVVQNVILKTAGGATIATAPLNYDEGGSAGVDGINFTGLNIAVPANGTTTVSVDIQLGEISSQAGTSGANIDVELDRYRAYSDSVTAAYSGTSTIESGFAVKSGNNAYVYKSIPTLTQVDLTNNTIGNGTAQDVYKFSVAADSKGDVDVKQFKLNVAWTDAGTTAALELESVKLYENNVDITSLATIQDEDGNTVTSTSGLLEDDGTLVVTFSTPRQVAASTTNTYAIRATPQAFGNETTEDRVSLYALDDTSAPTSGFVYLNAGTSTTTITKLFSSASADGSATDHNFIWSDRSNVSHSGTTGDWTNGYLVKNLPLGGETWSD